MPYWHDKEGLKGVKTDKPFSYKNWSRVNILPLYNINTRSALNHTCLEWKFIYLRIPIQLVCLQKKWKLISCCKHHFTVIFYWKETTFINLFNINQIRLIYYNTRSNTIKLWTIFCAYNLLLSLFETNI